MSEDHKAIALRWFDEVWNQRREATIDEVTAPDCRAQHEGADGTLSMEEFKAYWRAWPNGIPDVRMEVLFAVADGATVIVHWRARGTHSGPGLGIPPSGRPVDFSGLTSSSSRTGSSCAASTSGTAAR